MSENTKKPIFLFVLMFAIGLGVVLLPGAGHCQTKIPCLEKNSRGQWRINKKASCVQYQSAQFRQVVDRLTQLETFKAKLQKTCDKARESYKALDKNWKRAELRWDRQTKIYGNLLAYNQKEATTWRKAFYELKKQKVPPKSWTESPWLWFGVGVATTIAITVGTALIINAVNQPRLSVNQSPIMVPRYAPSMIYIRRPVRMHMQQTARPRFGRTLLQAR